MKALIVEKNENNQVRGKTFCNKDKDMTVVYRITSGKENGGKVIVHLLFQYKKEGASKEGNRIQAHIRLERWFLM